jgi:hypothetical protein
LLGQVETVSRVRQKMVIVAGDDIPGLFGLAEATEPCRRSRPVLNGRARSCSTFCQAGPLRLGLLFRLT